MSTSFPVRLRTPAAAFVLALALAASNRPVLAGGPSPVGARAGLDIARAAALSWAPDAQLVYLENDDEVDAGGASPRWGYLFRSSASGLTRFYSVRGGRIVEAGDLGVKLDPPALTDAWIDSDAARAAAEHEVGDAFRKTPGAHLRTMLLMRGAFDEDDPDRASWALVYDAPNAPSLFVVVDAAAGKVRRTWRG